MDKSSTSASASSTNIAEEALLAFWQDGSLHERFKNVLDSSRYLNKDFSDQEWKEVMAFRFPPGKTIYGSGYAPSGMKDSTTVSVRRQFRYKGKQVNIMLNRMAALVSLDDEKHTQDLRPDEQVVQPGKRLRPNWHASHWRNHDNASINPIDILPEPNRVNQERNTCKAHVDTPNYRCPHVPTCAGCSSTFDSVQGCSKDKV